LISSMPTLHDAYTARARIRSLIRKTPLLDAAVLARKTGARGVVFKPECLQNTGSFKIRGAANKILSLGDAEKKTGVITFSTGNHGKAVAHVAHTLGIPAVVCLSEHVAPYRAERIQALGAEVVRWGRSQDDAEAHYHEMKAARGLIPVVPFDDPIIIAGQATIALEIVADLPEIQVLLVPLSGGGLLAGMALAAKAINPAIHVVGISLKRSPAMLESLKAGRPVAVEEKDSIADSLLGGIGTTNRYTLPLVEKYVDEHLLVSEDEIKDGMFSVFETHRLIIEGAAAVTVGALLHQKIDVRKKMVGVLLSGSSIDSKAYLSIIQGGLDGEERKKSDLEAPRPVRKGIP